MEFVATSTIPTPLPLVGGDDDFYHQYQDRRRCCPPAMPHYRTIPSFGGDWPIGIVDDNHHQQQDNCFATIVDKIWNKKEEAAVAIVSPTTIPKKTISIDQRLEYELIVPEAVPRTVVIVNNNKNHEHQHNSSGMPISTLSVLEDILGTEFDDSTSSSLESYFDDECSSVVSELGMEDCKGD